MKKNLRIVSAAAAALLAVAPVAATSVSTAFAADTATVNVDGGDANKTADTGKFTLTVNNAFKLNNGDSASKLGVTLTKNAVPANATITYGNAKVYKATNVTVDPNKIAKVNTDSSNNNKEYAAESYLYSDSKDYNSGYVAVITITITGLKAGQTYKINDTNYTASDSNSIADVRIASPVFHIATQAALGTPYLKDKTNNKAVTSGNVTIDPTKYSVQGVSDAITAAYDKDVTDTTDKKATVEWVDLKQDIRDGLKAAGITPDTNQDETFAKPAAAFPVTVHLVASNGLTSSAVITVDPNSTKADATFPVITYYTKGASGAQSHVVPNGDSATMSVDADELVDENNKDLNVNYVPINGVVDTASIKKAVKAVVVKDSLVNLDVTVDASKVNTKVAGKYPVVVSATNPAKKTSKLIVTLTVGAKGATYKTVQSDGDIPVYKIEGNNVTDTKTTVKNGDQIAVFGDAIKVGDKSYTRINSADSDLYVETKYVDGSFKPAEKTSKTVMHNAYIYDKDHKRVGTKTLAAYTKVDVLGATTKLADGSLVYQIGDNQYVMADNIDGTVRTLSHNAYVYKTSKKRADSRVLRKGAKVTTYGSPYTFKNGKAYYRIGGPSKQYVKVANFN